jgi:hypothetical protein
LGGIGLCLGNLKGLGGQAVLMVALTAVQLCLRAGIPHALGTAEAALPRGERHIDELGLAHPSEVVVAHQHFAGVVIRRALNARRPEDLR